MLPFTQFMIGAAVVLFIFITTVWSFSIYNRLITMQHNIDKAWSNVDVLLKQRHDEVPKLIAICNEYMNYEKETLAQITAARENCVLAHNLADSSQAEHKLSHSLNGLFAVAENYPDLKANQSFIQLQGRISALENQISDRREFYNDTVNLYNISINAIPDRLIASRLHLQAKPLFSFVEDVSDA